MSETLTSFGEFNLENELLRRLAEVNKKYTIGLQKELIEAMMSKNFDIILDAKKRTGKSTGYLIPMINEAIKRKKKNDERKCVGLVITWSSESVKDITTLANEICKGLPVSILSGSKKKLTTDGENDYFIIVAKAILLSNSIPNVEHFFESLCYVVVEEACSFAYIDKNKFLVDIFKKLRSTKNTTFATILSSVDFKGTEYKLQAQFLQKPVNKISLIGTGLEKYFTRKSNDSQELYIDKKDEVFNRKSNNFLKIMKNNSSAAINY